jgi:hypothetical protein
MQRRTSSISVRLIILVTLLAGALPPTGLYAAPDAAPAHNSPATDRAARWPAPILPEQDIPLPAPDQFNPVQAVIQDIGIAGELPGLDEAAWIEPLAPQRVSRDNGRRAGRQLLVMITRAKRNQPSRGIHAHLTPL